jgi:hypothetical protein
VDTRFRYRINVECTSTSLRQSRWPYATHSVDQVRCPAQAPGWVVYYGALDMELPISNIPEWIRLGVLKPTGVRQSQTRSNCQLVAADSCLGVAECSCDHKYRGGVLVSNRVRIFTLVDPQAPCQNTHSPSEAISRIGGFFSFAARWMMLRAWLRQ